MAYKIFISYTAADSLIAKAIKNQIEQIYAGKVELFIAEIDILSGQQWKNEIMTKLNACDAIINLFTPDSILKPWIYVEWAYFWFNEKLFYIVHTGDVALSELIAPMQDRQSTDLGDKVQVSNLLKVIGRSVEQQEVTNEFIDGFISAVQKAKEEKLYITNSIYRNPLTELPAGDSPKKKLARYFYQIGETDVYARIAKEIRSDHIKKELVLDLLKDNKLPHSQELTLCNDISKSIDSADALADIARHLIALNNLDSATLVDITKSIAERNKGELRKLALGLIKEEKENTEYFKTICDFMCSVGMRNDTEFVKIPHMLVEKGRYESDLFLELVKMLTNSSSLKRLVKYMIKEAPYSKHFSEALIQLHGVVKTTSFKDILDELRAENEEVIKQFEQNHKDKIEATSK